MRKNLSVLGVSLCIGLAASGLSSYESLSTTQPVFFTFQQNNTQTLLTLQDQMEASTSLFKKKQILSEAKKLNGISSFFFIGKYINDEYLQQDVAVALCQMAIQNSDLTGTSVHELLSKSIGIIKGKEKLVEQTKLLLEQMPDKGGFTSLFNGQDLTGWKGLVANPIARNKMSADVLMTEQEKANNNMRKDWVVQNGLLNYTGHGDNLTTEKKYKNFEMLIDWRIQEKGDAGIYLRGTPQVQIWDISRTEVGAQVGSGGLYNNQKNKSTPLVVADNPVGQWNHFRIIMKEDKVTVYLNGVLVTDHIILENYWDRNLPIFDEEQIELQAHGTFVSYRNIYIKELN